MQDAATAQATMPHPGTEGLPPAVARYAQRKQKGELVVQAWLLHMQGGLSGREVGRRLKVHPDTVNGWLRDLRELVEDGQESKPQSPVGLSLFNADSLALERAELYDDAKRQGELSIRAKVLDSEQRRLGLDIQRVEQVTLQVTVQAMPPDARRAEILERVRRMALRNTLNVNALIDDAGGNDKGVGGPPQGGGNTPLLGAPSIPAPKKFQASNEAEPAATDDSATEVDDE